MCKVNRHFYKCPLCLAVCAIETEHQIFPSCQHCSTALEYMGRVERDNLVKDHVRCACDGRCTGAVGPKCDCHCGGVNHGTGAVVRFTTIEGKIVAETQPTAKQISEAREFIATRDAALDEWRRLNAAKNAGYIPRDQFMRWLALDRAISHARKLRSHAGRMKALSAVGHKPARVALPPVCEPSLTLAPISTAQPGRLF